MHNSPCIEQIGVNTYRCKNTDIIVETEVLPIRCGFCDEKVEYPSIGKQVMNLGKAVVDHTLTGFQRVEEEEFKKRIEICNKCEFFDSEQGRCKQCGCFIQIKGWWKEQKCPVDKW